LKTISADDLKQFPKLEILFLNMNKLVSLDGNLFQHTRKLQSVDFYANELEHVGENLLTGLENLKYASFQNNPCIDIYANTHQKVQELNDQLPIKCAMKKNIEL
jgi:Leucine-rich repeat (LRR) protein